MSSGKVKEILVSCVSDLDSDLDLITYLIV
jgi:hypothetical protein